MSGWPPPGAPGGYPQGGLPPPQPARSGSGGGVAALVAAGVGVVALLAVAVIVVALVVVSDDDGDGDDVAEEVFLEPISTAQDPFTASIGNDAPGVSSLGAAAGQAVTTRNGGEPGLYGGTRDTGSCDAEQLASFLEDEPEKAEAWAGVLGLRVADVGSYIDRLTPVVLRSDTRITNHGFVDGRANRIQAVLQAGTAVLVDDRGRPVTKCYCGNPLLPPEPSAQRYTGSRWDGFDDGSLTVITEVDVAITTFVLVDLDTGETFSRPVGSGGGEDGPAAPDTTTTTTAPATSTEPGTTQPPDTTEPPATTEPAGSDVAGSYTYRAEVAEGSNGNCTPYDSTFEVTTGPDGAVRFDAGAGGVLEGPLGDDGSFDLEAPLPSGEGRQTLVGRFATEGTTITISGSGTVDSGSVRCNFTFTGQRVP